MRFPGAPPRGVFRKGARLSLPPSRRAVHALPQLPGAEGLCRPAALRRGMGPVATPGKGLARFVSHPQSHVPCEASTTSRLVFYKQRLTQPRYSLFTCALQSHLGIFLGMLCKQSVRNGDTEQKIIAGHEDQWLPGCVFRGLTFCRHCLRTARAGAGRSWKFY